MKRTLLPMIAAALFALSLSACATQNSAAMRPASNPPSLAARAIEDRPVAPAIERAERQDRAARAVDFTPAAALPCPPPRN